MTGSTRPFPPGDYPVVVIGSGPGGLQVVVLAASVRDRPRGHLGGPRPGWHVPALAVLPAAAVVDQAARAGAARVARLRALRLEQPAGRRGRGARPPARRSWTAPRTSRPGPRWRRTSRRFAERARHRRPLRLPLDRDATARRRPDGRRLRGRDDRRRVPGAGPHRRGRCRPAVHAAGPRAWSSPTTTPTSARPSPTPAAGCSSSASRTPASSWPTACCRGRASSSLVSPSTRQAVGRYPNSLVGVRARYVQPYEDYVLGGGVADPRRRPRPHRAGRRRRRQS